MSPRLPSAEDVPQVRVAQDPGVQAPVEAFQSPLGIAANELAPAAEKYAKVAMLQENRRDTVDRSDLINQKTRENEEKLLELNTQSDLSREDVLTGYGAFLAQRKQEALNAHKQRGASADSLANLEIRLGDVDNQYIGKASAISVKVGKDKVDKVFNDRLSLLGVSAAQNPSLDNISKLTIIDAQTAADDLMGAYDPIEGQTKLRIAQEHIVLSATDRLIIQGRTKEAESLLIDAGMNKFLSPEKQREKRRQIEAVLSSEKQHTTKEVFNKQTKMFQFATEAQIAATPNLVPKDAAAKDKTERPIETTASRAIFSFAVSSEGGVFDADGNVKGLDQTKSEVVQNVNALASRIYADDKTITEAEAVSKARENLGLRRLLRSSVLGRHVTEQEIAVTAKNRKISIEEVKNQLGIK